MSGVAVLAESRVARAGRWCFRRPWLVVAVWAGVFVCGVGLSNVVFDRLAQNALSERAEATLGRAALDGAADSSGQVLGVVDNVDLASPGARTVIAGATDDIAGRADVSSVDAPQPSADNRALLITVSLKRLSVAERDAAVTTISERLHRIARDLRDAGYAGAEVRVGGDPVIAYETGAAHHREVVHSQLVTLPIALVVVVVAFGSLAAGAMPLLAAIVSGGSAMLVVLGFTFVTDVDFHVVVTVSLFALGLSIDYALLLVGRYREELFAGHAPDVALARAWATAGRTVVFSALVIAAALSGLLAFDLTAMRAIATAGISVALVAMATSLTLTAALLGLAGARIRPRPPATHHKQPRHYALSVGSFQHIAAAVQRRPWTVALVAGAILLLAAAPLRSMEFRVPGVADLSADLESVRVAAELGPRFDRAAPPTVTVVATDTDAAALDAWAAPFANDPAVAAVRPAVPHGPGLAAVDFVVHGDDTQSGQAQELVHRLRADRPAGAQWWVSGDAALLVDVTAILWRDLPYGIAVTLLAIVVLLFAMTGSLVVPLKAVLANLFSLGATLGLMALVFERGLLSGPLDTVVVPGLNPVSLVVILVAGFALSVDYEVFLISRVTEYVERDRDRAGGESRRDLSRLKRVTDTAVREGLQHTGRIITCAALLMVIVFGGFAAAKMSTVEQFGIGLALAVLIDATVVRCLLVPASMTLLGRWNWWAPRPLKRLYDRFGLRERPLPEPAAPATPAEAAAA